MGDKLTSDEETRLSDCGLVVCLSLGSAHCSVLAWLAVELGCQAPLVASSWLSSPACSVSREVSGPLPAFEITSFKLQSRTANQKSIIVGSGSRAKASDQESGTGGFGFQGLRLFCLPQ